MEELIQKIEEVNYAKIEGDIFLDRIIFKKDAKIKVLLRGDEEMILTLDDSREELFPAFFKIAKEIEKKCGVAVQTKLHYAIRKQDAFEEAKRSFLSVLSL